MDHAALPVDADTILAGLRPWVEQESPTFDPPAVETMLDLAGRELAAMDAEVARISGQGGFAGCLRARLPHASSQGGVLVLAHLDTVHPIGTLAALPWRRDGDRQCGPGVLDMKGGTYLALEALRALRRAAIPTALPVTILLTPDEEVGSLSTRAAIEAEAARHRYVLVPEPAREGGVVTGRYAIARFDLRATGRPSHAGSRLADGRSAIRAMAKRILQIEDMTGPDCTFSVGVVQGGRWVNCVATTCTAEALSMAKRQSDLDDGVARMMALAGDDDGVSFEVVRGVTRPVWEADAAGLRLYEMARALARPLGLALPHGSAAGGSDGNFTGAIGIPTLDGLGPDGTGYHTLDEHLLVSSLAPRTRLLAGLLATLA